jgi:NAD(P)-dependent dehydrogenase (short-subunit alcohol dehydrogenase family)
MTEQVRPPQRQDLPGSQRAMQPAPETAPRYPGSGRLAGKVALITGGDSGIGRATAELFAREGAKVAILYLSEDEDADDTLAAVAREGSTGIKIRGDVGDKAFCKEAVERTVAELGGLNVLVNDASEQTVQEDLRDISEEQLRRTFQSNIFGMFFMAQAALDHLTAGDAIVNVTSITSFKGNKMLVDYSSTKGAITTFTRALAAQVVDRGIRVNGVAPGPIWTPLIPASFPPEKVAEFGTQAEMGRAGQPNEVAPSILFLACLDSSYMTGNILHPNGGTPVGG